MSTAGMLLADAARTYAELGYPVFRLSPRSKLPVKDTHGLLDATTDVDQVEQWWREEPNCNIGIRTNGLIVIDPDLLDKETSDPKPNPWLTSERAQLLAVAPTQKTWSGGRQYIFRQPAGKGYRNTDSDIAPNVDTRGNDGYIVVAPSFVKKGNRSGYYQFAPGLELDIPPALLPEPPATLVAKLDEIEANRGKSGNLAGVTISTAPGGGSIPKGKRDSTLFNLGCVMRGGGFTEAEIKAALEVVASERCEQGSDFDPMKTAAAKAAQAAKYEPGQTPTGAEEPENAAGELEYQRITAAELDDGDYRTEFLIEGTLVAGQPLIIAGGKKCLKTNMLLDAAISLATATPMLGTLAVNRGCRVLVMSGESGMATIQETCRRICRAKERTLNSVPGLIFSPDLPRIGDIRHLDALERMIVGDEIEALFVDPAYLCMDMDGREGSLFASGEQLNGLSKVCASNGVTLGLCHHTKKGLVDPFAPPELEHIAWAGFQEFARQWWLLGRRERFDPDSDGVHKLWLNVGGSAGFASLWAVDITEGKYPAPRHWEVTVSHAAEAREQAVQQQQTAKADEKGKKHTAAVEAAKGRIQDALRGVDDHTETIDNIRARSGCKGAAFDDAFAALLRAGKLTATEITRRNKQSYPAYRYEFNNQP